MSDPFFTPRGTELYCELDSLSYRILTVKPGRLGIIAVIEVSANGERLHRDEVKLWDSKSRQKFSKQCGRVVVQHLCKIEDELKRYTSEHNAQSNDETAKLPEELRGKFVHPAIHIEHGFASVGVINRDNGGFLFSVITGEGGPYDAESLGEGIFTVPPMIHPQLAGRWRERPSAITLSTAVALLIDKLRSLVCFEDERWYSVVAVWAAGTYLIQAFPAFPYLQLTGEKGSGKTKVQDVLELVAFNALKVVDPTPAVLFRVVSALRPTLLIDEAEQINSKERQELRSIINAGYKSGAFVPRVEGKETRTLTFFEVYSPKCFASIRSLGSVTEDRCITTVMAKPQVADARQNREIDAEDPEWAVIRDGFYRLPFTHGEKTRALLKSGLALPVCLRARDRELWLPLLGIASTTDAESSLGIYTDVLGIAIEAVNERSLNFETEAVLGLLEARMDGTDAIRIHPIDLVEGLETALNRKGVRPEWVASRLRSIGFKKAEPPRDTKGVVYQIRAKQLAEFRQRYLPPEEPTNLHTSEPTETKEREMLREF